MSDIIFYLFILCSGIEQPKQILSLQQTNSTKIKQEQEEHQEEFLGADVTMAELKEEGKQREEKEEESVEEELNDSLEGEPAALTVDPVLTLDFTTTGLKPTLAMFPSKAVMCKIGILHTTFMNKALFPEADSWCLGVQLCETVLGENFTK